MLAESSGLTVVQEMGIWVGVLTGISGTVLGIVNTVLNHRDRKPRLRVRPILRTLISSVPSEDNETVVLMELANIGRVPVHGSIIGFAGTTQRGGFIKNPTPVDAGRWPRAIDPGTVVLLRFSLESCAEALRDETLNRALATSQTGELYYSSKADFREFKEALMKQVAGRGTTH